MLSNYSVLIADNSQIIRDLADGALRNKLNCESIVHAPSGPKSIEVVKSMPVDLVISDWNLSNGSGIELLRTVRSDKESFETPFIVMTSKSDSRSLLTALNEGATDCIMKPFRPALFIERAKLAAIMVERRRTARFLSQGKVTADICLNGITTIKGRIRDLSLSGVSVAIPHIGPTAIGAPAGISINSRAEKLHLKAELARQVDGINEPFDTLGFHFPPLSEADKETVLSLISTFLQEESFK